MAEWLETSLAAVQGGLLASVRILALLMTLPVLRERVLPLRVKALLAALTAFLLLPVIPLPETPARNELLFAFQIVGEAALGAAVGFALQLVLEGLRIAGEILEIQVGLSFNLGETDDPLSPTLTGQVYFLAASLIFLLSGAHRMALSGLAESFQAVPVGLAWPNPMLAHPDVPYATPNITDYAAAMFVAAAKLSAPIIVTMLVITFVFGLVSRTMPQLNIFIVSYPIRIVLGFSLLMIGLPLVARIVEQYVEQVPDVATSVIRYFAAPGAG